MKTLAIIPARGGSKRVPGKNLLEICGKSLLAWTVEDALACEEIDHVLVSSDDRGILDCVLKYSGVVAWERVRGLATDTATTESVIEEVLGTGISLDAVDTIVLLQCTTPIRQPDTLSRALKEYRERGLCCMFSAVDVTGWTWGGDGKEWIPDYEPWERERSQDLDHCVRENGSFWIFGADHIEKHGARLCLAAVPFMMHPLDSFDIDEPEDVEIIRQLMPIRRKL